jgi:hypothetical protein
MYLNHRIYGSIPTEDKNSTRKWGGEYREVAVPGLPKMVGPEILHKTAPHDLLHPLL